MRYMQRQIASDVGALLRESDDTFWNPMANLETLMSMGGI